MSKHTLDTSGQVAVGRNPVWGLLTVGFSDLPPFAQGYVEALLQSLDAARMAAYRAAPWGSKGREVPIPAAFSWLAPEALALILTDCGDYGRYFTGTKPHENGGHFWRNRQYGHLRDVTNDGVTRHFPPLAPYLREDGKIDLKEAA